MKVALDSLILICLFAASYSFSLASSEGATITFHCCKFQAEGDKEALVNNFVSVSRSMSYGSYWFTERRLLMTSCNSINNYFVYVYILIKIKVVGRYNFIAYTYT